jgi:hypothetical protein
MYSASNTYSENFNILCSDHTILKEVVMIAESYYENLSNMVVCERLYLPAAMTRCTADYTYNIDCMKDRL